MNNHYAKFEYKDMNTVEDSYYTNQTPQAFRVEKMSQFKTLKMRKYLSNVHKIKGAHRQCVNNHYAKFEYKGIKKNTKYYPRYPKKCCG